MLWKRTATLEQLNQQSQGCMVGHLGIQFTRLALAAWVVWAAWAV